MKTNETNIFQKGSLCSFSTSCWTGKIRIQKALLDSLVDDPGKKSMTGYKELVARDALSPIVSCRSAAYMYLKSIAIPSPLRGAVIVAHGRVAEVDKRLSEFRVDFDAAVDVFVQSLADLIETAKTALGPTLFNRADYLDPDEMRGQFGMDWSFMTLAGPDASLQAIAPDAYAKEMARFRETLLSAEKAASQLLCTELHQIVKHAVERLSDENAKFKAGTITNFTEFFGTFKDRNLWGDAELDQIVAKATDVLNGVTPQDLRDDTALRADVAKELMQVEATLMASITRKGRKIVMSDEVLVS